MEKLLESIIKQIPEDFNEVRLNLNKPIVYKVGNISYELKKIATSELLTNVLKIATANSVYAVGEYISDGYISYKNGIRIGLAGTYTIENKKPKMIKNLNGLVIRIPHQIYNCSKVIGERHFGKNILVVAKPYAGKTTFLRDLARRMSKSRQVVVIDERGELYGGGCLDLGYSMVVGGVTKANVYTGIIRALSPEILVMDEMFGTEDYQAVQTMIKSGISVVGGLHGANFENIPEELSKLFDVKILLSTTPTVGSVVDVKYV